MAGKKAAAVQLVGTRGQWKRIPQPVRELVGNAGRDRLTRIRAAISADAELPMPPIRVEPWGWTAPSGTVWGEARPLLMESGHPQWGVLLPASTLLVFDDDAELRRVLCHEFAHCLWWDSRIVKEAKEGHQLIIDPPPVLEPGQDLFEWQAARDAEQLVDPALWFGRWDAEHFLVRCGAGEESQIRLIDLWTRPGLPTRTPKSHFVVKGPVEIPDEIADRALALGGTLIRSKRDPH